MHTLPLPASLLKDIQFGRRPLPARERARLQEMLRDVEKPLPELYDLDGINEANRLWRSEYASLYLGMESALYSPGLIDPKLAVIIGHGEPDSPIALDYRVSPPRVLYFATVNHHDIWLELASDYESLSADLLAPTSTGLA